MENTVKITLWDDIVGYLTGSNTTYPFPLQLSKITFHAHMPLSVLEGGLAWKVRRKACTFHACMPYRSLQQGGAWKVNLFKAGRKVLRDFLNQYNLLAGL